MTFEEFETKWKNKGIAVSVVNTEDRFDGEKIELHLTTQKEDRVLMHKENAGMVVEPDVFYLTWGCELEDTKRIDADNFIIFMQLGKEFAELTKDIKTKPGEQISSSKKIFIK